jgi:Ca2+-binding EF-hand superfamily protein
MAQGKSPVVTQTAFSKIDTNGDGIITVAEYDAYWKGRFSDIDANKDGKVMAAEFEASSKQQFSAMDADKDSSLVAQEFVAYYCGPEAKAPKKAKAKPMKKIAANKDGKIGKDECVAFWMARYSDMDTNKDGKVTMDEFLAAAKKQFKDMDKNGDGVIAIQEFDYYYTAQDAKAKK